MTSSTSPPQGTALDLEGLARWMDQHRIDEGGGLPYAQRLSGGSQNELYRIDRGGQPMALRLRPAGAGEKRHDELRREIRLLRGLRGTDVPHAGLIEGEENPELLGGPFYLMTLVDGWAPGGGSWPSPFEEDISLRHSLGLGLMEGAAKLARVDWRAQGLEGFGRPDGFHDRQVERWTNFLSSYQFRELPGLDGATEWLRRNRPRHWEPGIMHGDYQFANVMFTHDVPARLAAVIDWEMTTIGDPLLDVGWALHAWAPEGDDMIRYLNFDGMPSRSEMLDHYESISGRSTEDIDYYVVLARWKLGIVLEKSYARYVESDRSNKTLAGFGDYASGLIRKADELARSLVGKSHWR